VKLRYQNSRLAELEVNPGFDGGYAEAVVRGFRKRVQQIRNADDERTLRAYKSLHFEKLKGNRRHQHSLRINDQYRLVMELVGHGADTTVVIIGIEDYH
jgi:proteic killer suppression protein